jgi:hypothetical protein
VGSIGRKRGGLRFVAFLMTWVCSVAASRDARAADNTPEAAPFRVRVPHNEVAQAVKRALEGADRLLAEPACQEVLTDFRDASARTLKEVLDGSDVSARGYLRWIVFSDGRGLKACSSKATLAVTEPGSRVVFICPTAFVEAVSGNPEQAEATLIHEMLHSLGLGENPPRSRDITERVLSRCDPRRRRSSLRESGHELHDHDAVARPWVDQRERRNARRRICKNDFSINNELGWSGAGGSEPPTTCAPREVAKANLFGHRILRAAAHGWRLLFRPHRMTARDTRSGR